jgi:3'-5' exonuclease
VTQDGRRRGPESGYLVFDIETQIDKELVRDVFRLAPGATTALAYERMRDDVDGGFLPVTVHAPVSIALGWVSPGRVLERIEVLRADEIGEEEVVRSFWKRVEPFRGTLVTFSGRVFDLPVLELRALRYGVSLPWYFGGKSGFRGRNDRHDDLYDVMSNRGSARLRGGLDLLAKLIGLPGKGLVTGAMVQELWERGDFDTVHRYCRRDVIQTYYLFLHIERLRGRIDAGEIGGIEEATRAFRDELGET